MSSRTNALPDELASYLRQLAKQGEDPILARLRAATRPLPRSGMQISVEQGRLMALLIQVMGASRTIEVGVFTGYSALCVARHLPPNGRLVACDISAESAAIGQPFWEEAGVADRIDLRIGPAADTLARLIEAGEAGTYDFAFIDADKAGYPTYYEQCLTLLRPGGLIGFDNALMGGRVTQADPPDESARIMRALNQQIAEDERVTAAMVPIGDGLLLLRKR